MKNDKTFFTRLSIENRIEIDDLKRKIVKLESRAVSEIQSRQEKKTNRIGLNFTTKNPSGNPTEETNIFNQSVCQTTSYF